MLLLRLGLYAAAIGALYATWASSQAGYPLEVALLRGLLAFMAISAIAYIAELIVVTAPVPRGAELPYASEDADGDPDVEGDEGSAAPISLAAVRAQGGAAGAGASGGRRAA